jgi:hypothetical protein
MAEGKFVAYYRVSTKKQGRSGLGLEIGAGVKGRFRDAPSGPDCRRAHPDTSRRRPPDRGSAEEAAACAQIATSGFLGVAGSSGLGIAGVERYSRLPRVRAEIISITIGSTVLPHTSVCVCQM